jgi:hypothetical protein
VKYCSERCRLEAMSRRAIQAYRSASLKDHDDPAPPTEGSASVA